MCDAVDTDFVTTISSSAQASSPGMTVTEGDDAEVDAVIMAVLIQDFSQLGATKFYDALDHVIRKFTDHVNFLTQGSRDIPDMVWSACIIAWDSRTLSNWRSTRAKMSGTT